MLTTFDNYIILIESLRHAQKYLKALKSQNMACFSTNRKHIVRTDTKLENKILLHANFLNGPYKLKKMYMQSSEPCTSYVHESKETLMKSNEDMKAYLQKRCMTLANLQQKKSNVSTEFRSTQNLGRNISTNLKDYKLLNTVHE
jgi:hypothetical protein